MALNYTTLEIELAGILKEARKRHALIIHSRDADNASYARRLYTAANGFSTSDSQEAAVLAELVGHHDKTDVPLLEDVYRRYVNKALGDRGLGRIIAEDLGLEAADRGRLIEVQYDDRNTDGTVAILNYLGIYGQLRRDMVLQAKSVAASAAAVGSMVAGGSNYGTLTATSKSAQQYARPGTVFVKCTDPQITRPGFTVTEEFTKRWPGRLRGRFSDRLQKADRPLIAEKSWEDFPTGVNLLLTRSGLAAPTETDPNNLFATHTIGNPRDGDGDHGIFFFKVTRQASDVWLVEVYADAARLRKRGVVTPSPSGTSGTHVCSIVLDGGTTIQTTFSKANAHALLAAEGNSDSSFQLDIKSPRLGDFWTLPVTNDGAGVAQEKLAEVLPASLPTSGSPTFTDSNFNSISVT